MIDFLSYFPSIFSKSALHDAAVDDFIDNDIVDSKLFLYSDLHTLIRIYKTVKFTTKVDRIVRNNFNELYEEQL